MFFPVKKLEPIRRKNNLKSGENLVRMLADPGFQDRIKLEERIRKWLEMWIQKQSGDLPSSSEVKSPPTIEGKTGLISALGRFHMPWVS